jgi:Autochaperone Domain Type 1
MIATSGGVSLATGLGAYGVNADGAGSSIKLGSATITTSGAGATGIYASDRAASGGAGTISASGTLNIQTKNASAAAIALQGDGAAINATGGGTIAAAGTAIAFLGGTGQSATFDNFAIGNLSGDLVFADPSIATLNLNNTIANAGNNNLLNATAGSAFALNANASMLTGAIRTDAASTTNVNLTNNTAWSLTASSNVTNLNVTHSIIVFAPPGAGGAFKTLTVNNYAGNGANITMNVALSGSNSASDQIIVNSGKATGSTLLTINNVGGLGGQTSGAGIPSSSSPTAAQCLRGLFHSPTRPWSGDSNTRSKKRAILFFSSLPRPRRSPA